MHRLAPLTRAPVRPGTGALRESMAVRPNAVMTDLSGGRAVYHVGNEIHVWNLTANRTHLVFTRHIPADTLLIDGRWIVFKHRYGNQVFGILLPPLG